MGMLRRKGFENLQFLCLLLKMLQIQPEKEIVLELIRNDDFKYAPQMILQFIQIRENLGSILFEISWKTTRNL